MNTLSPDISLLRRQVKGAVLDDLRALTEPRAIHRPGGLVARLAATVLLARAEKRSPDAVAKQHFRDDCDVARLIELRAAIEVAAMLLPFPPGEPRAARQPVLYGQPGFMVRTFARVAPRYRPAFRAGQGRFRQRVPAWPFVDQARHQRQADPDGFQLGVSAEDQNLDHHDRAHAAGWCRRRNRSTEHRLRRQED